MSTISTKSSNTSSSEDDNINELRRGPWTMEEDTILIHYIACHGEGRWNLLAKCSGLRRTGKSCRLRWLNYLKPDVKRGNLTPEEQLLILDLHSKWGNRWSKIAQYLPGRTDNEIKNYWRTRVQKQAKHLKIDAESAAFQDIIRRFWMPRLIQKIEGSSTSASSSTIPMVQNSIVPVLVDTNAQQQDILRHEIPINMSGLSMNLEQCSDSESMNMSQISQFYEYPNNSFQQMASINNDQTTNTTNNNNTATFLEGYSYDMDVFGHTSVSQGKGLLENPGGVCHVEGGDWAENDFFASMWNMDELWQHKS